MSKYQFNDLYSACPPLSKYHHKEVNFNWLIIRQTGVKIVAGFELGLSDCQMV